MVRAPCCEKMGLKRGPWTHEEDLILIRHINLHGHDNWRALPKQAGLLRCGKSCRLRWTNYLRPDIKRGNFSREEEDAIIELHEMLGNRWSAIAARLPGRTDNEIKNVWHTHLKKRLNQNQASTKPVTKQAHSVKMQIDDLENKANPITYSNPVKPESPQHSSSDISSVTTTTTTTTTTATTMEADDALDNYFPDVDENFWSDIFSDHDSDAMSGFPTADHVENFYGYNSSKPDGNGMDFWYHLFTTAGGLPELPDF